jgi:hypothetical protein
VCFSPQADFITAIGVTAIGVDARRNIRGRSDHLLFATLPLILGVHELVENFDCWGLQGHVPHEAVVALAAFTADGFASLWCVYAAISTGAIALHMRYAKPHRAEPYLLT